MRWKIVEGIEIFPNGWPDAASDAKSGCMNCSIDYENNLILIPTIQATLAFALVLPAEFDTREDRAPWSGRTTHTSQSVRKMPITLLHLGPLALTNKFANRKVSNISFLLVNLWIDQGAITAWLQGIPLPTHYDPSHTLWGASVLAVVIAIFGVRSMPWVLGAFLGAFTHILFDSLVHADMNPLAPMKGNPFYLGLMQPLSLILLALTVWLVAQNVSFSADWLKTKNAKWRTRKNEADR